MSKEAASALTVAAQTVDGIRRAAHQDKAKAQNATAMMYYEGVAQGLSNAQHFIEKLIAIHERNVE